MKCIVLDTLHCRPTLPDGGEGVCGCAWVGLFFAAAVAAVAVQFIS